MSSWPDRPDLDQLRTQVKELKRAFELGEQAALDRVLASHPKFAGRPAERMEGWHSSLRDARATIAREFGLIPGGPAGRDRWSATLEFVGLFRHQHGSLRRSAGPAPPLLHHVHFLLASLKLSAPTVSSEVLTALGLSYERARERVARWDKPRRKSGTSSTPAYQLVLGWVQGIAIGMGASSFDNQPRALGPGLWRPRRGVDAEPVQN
ncbi:MAG: hypothetical protein ACRDWA_04180 [Acidimicrobiia bacterium]